MLLGRGLQVRAQAVIHLRRRNRRARGRRCDAHAAARVHLGDDALGGLGERIELRLGGIAELQVEFGVARHDRRRVRLELKPAHGPHRAFGRELGKFLVDALREFVERCRCVAAARHHGRAGVVLLAVESEADAAQADDPGHHADTLAAIVQRRPLFDVRLEKARIAFARNAQPRRVRQPGLR